MGRPTARQGDLTASGDAILGPCVANVQVAGAPVSVLGDAVVGPAIAGAVSVASRTVLVAGRPAAHVGSAVTGTNPSTGAPATSNVAVGAPTVHVG